MLMQLRRGAYAAMRRQRVRSLSTRQGTLPCASLFLTCASDARFKRRNTTAPCCHTLLTHSLAHTQTHTYTWSSVAAQACLQASKPQSCSCTV